jgi:protein arginine N-methyltransferase 1
MGYCLLYESMLDSVLVARDKFLKKDTGLMLPSKASIWIAGIEDEYYHYHKYNLWT